MKEFRACDFPYSKITFGYQGPVEISLDINTGEVTINPPDFPLADSAKEFWKAISEYFPGRSTMIGSSLTFKEYQDLIWGTAVYPNKGNNYTYPSLGLGGESGEVLEKIKKALRDDGGVITDERKAEIEKEIGDVLWYAAALCHEIGLEMEDVARKNIDKQYDRKRRGVLHGSGDNR